MAKRCNKGEKKQMFGTGLNLALVLILVQSYIYLGATFSTVPAKRYECPSITSSEIDPKFYETPAMLDPCWTEIN